MARGVGELEVAVLGQLRVDAVAGDELAEEPVTLERLGEELQTERTPYAARARPVPSGSRDGRCRRCGARARAEPARLEKVTEAPAGPAGGPPRRRCTRPRRRPRRRCPAALVRVDLGAPASGPARAAAPRTTRAGPRALPAQGTVAGASVTGGGASFVAGRSASSKRTQHRPATPAPARQSSWGSRYASRPAATVRSTRPASGRSDERGVPPPRQERVRAHRPLVGPVDDDEIGGRLPREPHARPSRGPRTLAGPIVSASIARVSAGVRRRPRRGQPTAVSIPLMPLAAGRTRPPCRRPCGGRGRWRSHRPCRRRGRPGRRRRPWPSGVVDLTRSDASYGDAVDRPVGERIARRPGRIDRVPGEPPRSRKPFVGEGEVVGVTSQVTGRPAALAARTSSIAPAVERWVRWSRARGSSTRTSARTARSRATAAVSPDVGQPRRPRIVAIVPSGPRPGGLVEVLGVVDDRQPSIPVRSAWRRRVAPRTGAPSSEKPATPASASSPIAARVSPRRPALTAPYGSTETGDPDAAAAARTRATTPGSSAGGSVFGIAHTVVKPRGRRPSARSRRSRRPRRRARGDGREGR